MTDYFNQEGLVEKAEFGAEAIASLRKNVTKLKNEGKKIGTNQDNKKLRDRMYSRND